MMIFRQLMIDTDENLGWCRPYISDRVSVSVLQEIIESLIIDGNEVDVTEENLMRAAKIVNPNYDDYDGWDVTHI